MVLSHVPGNDNLLLAVGEAMEAVLPPTPPPVLCSGCEPQARTQQVCMCPECSSSAGFSPDARPCMNTDMSGHAFAYMPPPLLDWRWFAQAEERV